MTSRPLIKYNISCGDSSINLDDDDTMETVVEQSLKVSYQKGHNEIKVRYISENCSLSRVEVRRTSIDEPYGLGIGSLVYNTFGSISAHEYHEFVIDVNAINFPTQGYHRLAFYCRSAIDNTWSYKFLVFSTNGLKITTTDGGKEIFALVDHNV